MIILLLANGFEEIEALTPLDLLRRADLPVLTVGIDGQTVVGAHGIPVVADTTPDRIDASNVEMVILPGGMPGTTNLAASPFVTSLVRTVYENGGRLAAICAAPSILGDLGLLSEKKAVCYPGYESRLRGATIVDESVVTDGRITTARGMGVSFAFGLELLRLTIGEARAAEIAASTMAVTTPTASKPKPDHRFPSVDLLCAPSIDEEDVESEAQATGEKLLAVLRSFGVQASIRSFDCGPRIIRYELVPAKGVTPGHIVSRCNDVALAFMEDGIRAEILTNKRNVVAFEIPRKKTQVVHLRELIENSSFIDSRSKTLASIGKDVSGMPVYYDIAKMPHALIAGATGMGKSVCMNAILLSILFKATPDEVKLIMIDPKCVEFRSYNGIPHLLRPVVTDPKQAVDALAWAVREMDRRYELIGLLNVKSIDDYNEKVTVIPSLGDPIPKIVIVIDELSDLMYLEKESAEEPIRRIAQKARAAGIHLLIGTQCPTADVIPSSIKASIPTRIACKVVSDADSRFILGCAGAEKLLGHGDMLFLASDASKPLRVQGAYVSDKDLDLVADFLGSCSNECAPHKSGLDEIDRAVFFSDFEYEGEEDGDEEEEDQSAAHAKKFRQR